MKTRKTKNKYGRKRFCFVFFFLFSSFSFFSVIRFVFHVRHSVGTKSDAFCDFGSKKCSCAVSLSGVILFGHSASEMEPKKNKERKVALSSFGKKQKKRKTHVWSGAILFFVVVVVWGRHTRTQKIWSSAVKKMMAAAGKMRPSLFGYRLPRIHQTQAKTKMRRVKPKQFIFGGGGGGVYAVSRFMAGRECALFFLVVCCCFAGFGKWCIFLCVLGGGEREEKKGGLCSSSFPLSLSPPKQRRRTKKLWFNLWRPNGNLQEEKKKEKRKQKKFGGIARRT